MSPLNEARRMQKLAGIEPHSWSWADTRSVDVARRKRAPKAGSYKVGDQVQVQGRLYKIEAITDMLAHLALVNPNDLTPDEIARQQDGRISVNPKYLTPNS